MALTTTIGGTTSNSYASELELTEYADLRGITLTGSPSALLIKAMDYIEQQPFKGDKATDDQALQWPRYGVYIDGYYVEIDTIPQLLKDAQMEAALAVDAGNDPMSSIGRETKREKLGELEVEYMDGARGYTYNRKLEMKLTKLIKSGARTATAIRA